MAITVHDNTNYLTDRTKLLAKVEADIAWAYVDSVGIPTFGIGNNLRTHGELVLGYLGFDFSGQYLTGDALTQEQSYGAQLDSAFDVTYPVGTFKENIADNNPAKVALDAILAQRRQYFLGLPYTPENFVSEAAYNTFRNSLVSEFEISDANVRQQILGIVLDGYTATDANGNSYDIRL